MRIKNDACGLLWFGSRREKSGRKCGDESISGTGGKLSSSSNNSSRRCNRVRTVGFQEMPDSIALLMLLNRNFQTDPGACNTNLIRSQMEKDWDSFERGAGALPQPFRFSQRFSEPETRKEEKPRAARIRLHPSRKITPRGESTGPYVCNWMTQVPIPFRRAWGWLLGLPNPHTLDIRTNCSVINRRFHLEHIRMCNTLWFASPQCSSPKQSLQFFQILTSIGRVHRRLNPT